MKVMIGLIVVVVCFVLISKLFFQKKQTQNGQINNDTANNKNVNTDDMFLEVFLDEANENFSKIDTFMNDWQTEPSNLGVLTEIRRCFHSLKGAGRMVGATVIADVAESVEHVLNSRLENGMPATAEIIEFVKTAKEHIMVLTADLENKRPPTEGYQQIIERAKDFKI